MAGDQFTIEEMKLGIDHILVEFLENICQVPETFTDFPINDELLKAYRARTTKEFRHAQLVLKKVPIFKALRSKLCPHTFNEDTFWSIYFRLTNNIIKDILRDVDDSSNVPLLALTSEELTSAIKELADQCGYLKKQGKTPKKQKKRYFVLTNQALYYFFGPKRYVTPSPIITLVMTINVTTISSIPASAYNLRQDPKPKGVIMLEDATVEREQNPFAPSGSPSFLSTSPPKMSSMSSAMSSSPPSCPPTPLSISPKTSPLPPPKRFRFIIKSKLAFTHKARFQYRIYNLEAPDHHSLEQWIPAIRAGINSAAAVQEAKEKEMEETLKQKLQMEMKSKDDIEREKQMKASLEQQLRQQMKEEEEKKSDNIRKNLESQLRAQYEAEIKQKLEEERKRLEHEVKQRLDAEVEHKLEEERRKIEQEVKKAISSGVEIDPSQIKLGEVIGDGSFGTVYKAICRSKEVAVKVLHNQNLDEDVLEEFRHEIAIMSKIYHPNILLYMGACTQPGKLMIVTELMKNNLENILLDHTIKLTLTQRLKMAKDAALGMNWLHCSNPVIIHRDVKCTNFLVDANYRVVVADFGLSETIKPGNQTYDSRGARGTFYFTAPEILKGIWFDEKSDTYSFGIVLWEIYTRKSPFFLGEVSFEELVEAVCWENKRPTIPDDCPGSLKALIKTCWDGNPAKRPSFEKIIQMLDEIIAEVAKQESVQQQQIPSPRK